jgi:hypothetical protein
MYIITNPHYTKFHGNEIQENYKGITKLTNLDNYSSAFSEKISDKMLEQMIKDCSLLD